MNMDLLTYDLDDLYDRIDQKAAFEWYLARPITVGVPFSNPLRDDPTPSASLKWFGNRLVLVDFGNSYYNGDFLRLVMNTERIGYKQAYKNVWSALVGELDPSNNRPEEFVDKEVTKILVKKRSWNYNDREYWSSHGIDIDLLTDVYPCESVRIGDKVISDQFMYAYDLFRDAEDGIYEIYRPFQSRENKFRYNGSKRITYGLYRLPEMGELLILAKSKKDCLFLQQRGYNAICKTGEGTQWEEDLIFVLKQKFTNVVVFYDRDRQGVHAARRLQKKHKIDFFFIPKKWDVKDITDFYKQYGEQETKELLCHIGN